MTQRHVEAAAAPAAVVGTDARIGAETGSLSALLRRLRDTPWNFGFTVLMRRLGAEHSDQPRIGLASRPQQERFRLGQTAALTFAPREIAEVVLPEEQKVLAIPATAILSAPYGDSVYVVESSTATNSAPTDLVVRQKFVRTGRSNGDYISVESGLLPGERVVNAGVFKLRNGMSVVENNDVVPKASAKPKPSDS